MTSRVFIDGAAGTTGLEIRDRLTGRPEFELVVLGDDERKDPSARRAALNEADFAILCLPDKAAREAVALIENDRVRVIDASSAHRVTEGWTYGFPEIVGRDAIAKARFVSNPGCYPTGFIGLVAPLVRAGLLPRDWPFTVHAVSGYSGGGKALIDRFGAEGDIAWRAYGFDLAHKHLPEMQEHAGLAHPVIFSPSVIPAFRGMAVEVPLHLGAMNGGPDALRLEDALAEFYAGSKIVTVSRDHDRSELLIREGAEPTDAMQLHVFGNEAGYHARLVATLDNLGKGASGAAVQSLNLMAGLDETEGLRLPA
ncbi:N-acetyl-gamma-glutamyl-phosphate reductase [Qipengyuania sp. JC766]|uniref:N-acetyl-gamma-glutamyl-phosphate reductase n=1 Tax=Qipengyuania sp. JC766 TaxID=3232139 RepID=UPI003459B37B